MAKFCRLGREKRQDFAVSENQRPDFSPKSRFGPQLAQRRGVTAILALPELAPPAETPSGSDEGQAPAKESFLAVLAAVEEPETEASEEGPDIPLAPAPVPASVPPLSVRLFAFGEAAPEPAPPEPGIAAASNEAEPTASAEPNAPESAPSRRVAEPAAFELEVQAGPPAVAEEAGIREADHMSPSIALPAAEEEIAAFTALRRPSAPAAEAEVDVATAPGRDFEAPEAAETGPAAARKREAPEAAETGPEQTILSAPRLPAPSSSTAADFPAAPRLAQRPAGAANPPELHLPSEPPRSAETPRVALRLEPREGTTAPPVDVVVAQRGASLHFSVHSADGRLGAEMRNSLGELTERLEMLGYRAAAVIPAERAHEIPHMAASERAWSEGGDSPASGFAGQEKRQGRRDRNQWRLEMQKQSETTA